MAANVLAAGHDVYVFDLVADSSAPLVGRGATATGSAAEASSGAEVVMMSLPGPAEVRDALLGPAGVLDATSLPSIVVDLSTSSPVTVAELGAACAASGVVFVDAPVSGGLARAQSGTLAVLVGASPEVFERVRPVLEAVGTDVLHVGPPGTGTIAKLVNNQLFLAGAVAVQEAYVLGAKLGLGPADLHAIIASSSAAPYAKLAPLLLGRAFDDVIFRLDIAAKDLRLALESAGEAGVDVPVARAASEVFDASGDHGDGHRVFHATLRELERRAEVELPPLRRSRSVPT